jgi:hypothetical protein
MKVDDVVVDNPVVDPFVHSSLKTAAPAIDAARTQNHMADGDNPDKDNLVGEAPDCAH